MTPNEIRDEMARMDGWLPIKGGHGSWMRAEWGEDHADCVRAGVVCGLDHPYPDTLASAAAALPKGWTWERKRRGDGVYIWIARTGCRGYGDKEVGVADTGNETDDRFRLAYDAKVAMKGAAS